MSVNIDVVTDSGSAIVTDSGQTILVDFGQRRHFWRILIFDRANNLVDIPQTDIESWSCKTVLNGGSSTGQIIFVRDFNKIGALGYGYQVLIWFWSEGQVRPLDPYYSGTIIDELDQEQLDARGRITVNLKGDFSLLDAGIVTSQVTGGIGGPTPMPDAAAYLNVLIPTYQPATNFIAPQIPSSMFQLWPLNFDGTALSAAIDTVVKQSLDSNGHSFIWYVRTDHLLRRQVIVELDQNPNWNTSAEPFSEQFPGITGDQYEIENIYRNIVNVVSVYGGTDPTTGVQVFGVYQDATSVSQYGPWESKLSVPALLSNAAAQSYAQTWLAQNAYQSATGIFRLFNPDPSIIVGNWVQYNEAPKTSAAAASIKQVRIVEIDVQCQGQRVEQKLMSSSPIPYLDEAIYRLGQNVSANSAIAISNLTVNTQLEYIVGGGAVAAASASPAKVTISQCQAVFPGGQVVAPALAATVVADSGTSATGDGDYTVWVNSTGSFVFYKGTPPSTTTTLQQLAAIAVINGTAYVTDQRTLIAAPAISPSTPLVLSGSVTLGTSPNAGAGAYDQPISFSLQTPYGGLANPSLANLQLGWRVNGATNAIAQTGALIAPTASGSYTATAVGIGAGSAVDIFVQGIDTHGITTPWLYLATTSAPGIVGQTIGVLIPTFVVPAIAGPVTATGSYTIYDSSTAGTTETLPGSGTYTVTGSFSLPAPSGYAYTLAINSGGTLTNLVSTITTANGASGLIVGADFSFNIPGGAHFDVKLTVANPSGWSCSAGQFNISAVRTSN